MLVIKFLPEHPSFKFKFPPLTQFSFCNFQLSYLLKTIQTYMLETHVALVFLYMLSLTRVYVSSTNTNVSWTNDPHDNVIG